MEWKLYHKTCDIGLHALRVVAPRNGSGGIDNSQTPAKPQRNYPPQGISELNEKRKLNELIGNVMLTFIRLIFKALN